MTVLSVNLSTRRLRRNKSRRADGTESICKAEGTITGFWPLWLPIGETEDAFDSYSFKGRQSTLVGKEDHEGYAAEGEKDVIKEPIEARRSQALLLLAINSFSNLPSQGKICQR